MQLVTVLFLSTLLAPCLSKSIARTPPHLQQRHWLPQPSDEDYPGLLLQELENLGAAGGGYHPYYGPRAPIRTGPLRPIQEQHWRPTISLGEVVGVAVNKQGDPVILHRGGRIWEQRSFNESHQLIDNTKLPVNCVVVLDKYTALAKDLWGANTFLMPHGITIDPQGHIWVTDVGLHQVIKYSGANQHPLMTLGEAEVPGSDDRHFCQPTSTAVTSLGEVFVADGYCNNRVMRFSSDGTFLGQIGDRDENGLGGSAGSLHLPHGIALDELLDTLCVADREGRRVVCYRAGLLDHRSSIFGALVSIIPEVQHRRVFDIASLGDGVIVGVGGSTAEGSYGVAFTADISSATILNVFEPKEGLHNPHAIAAAPDSSALYIAELTPNTIWKFSLY